MWGKIKLRMLKKIDLDAIDILLMMGFWSSVLERPAKISDSKVFGSFALFFLAPHKLLPCDGANLACTNNGPTKDNRRIHKPQQPCNEKLKSCDW